MEIETSLLNKNVIPGDTLAKSIQTSNIIRIGNGILQTENSLISCMAGLFRCVDSNFYFIEENHKRVKFLKLKPQYVPKVEDFVIGMIVESSVEFYKVDLGSSCTATLSAIGFDGASKRNKPSLKQRDLVYCR
jgi:exosome complex component RRP40